MFNLVEGCIDFLFSRRYFCFDVYYFFPPANFGPLLFFFLLPTSVRLGCLFTIFFFISINFSPVIVYATSHKSWFVVFCCLKIFSNSPFEFFFVPLVGKECIISVFSNVSYLTDFQSHSAVLRKYISYDFILFKMW